MSSPLSSRLEEIINALPLRKGMRILEIGCGPGTAAREIASRIGNGFVLGIDRSATAIQQATKLSSKLISTGNLNFRKVSIEEFSRLQGEKPFDMAIAIRVGALDGRHPELQEKAFIQLRKALKKNGQLFIDGGQPLIKIPLR